jgi:hypothetical protein
MLRSRAERVPGLRSRILYAIRNSPSLRSPNRSCRIDRTRSESVPGTVNVFESSGLNRVLA